MTTGRKLSTISWISVASALSCSVAVAIHGCLDGGVSCWEGDERMTKPKIHNRSITQMMTAMILLRRFGCLSVGCILWKVTLCYMIGPSAQKSLRPHFSQHAPRHTESNCSQSGSTIDRSSVKMPFSKFRLFSFFAPSPAPVRLALPK